MYYRPTKPADVAAIIKQLAKLPRLGAPLRRSPSQRAILRHYGIGLIRKLDLPRSDIERSLRGYLRQLIEG